MSTPFPGMDPFLEQPGLWKEVHTGLMVEIQKNLTGRLRPKYRVAIEQRTYLALFPTEDFIGQPDVLVVSPFDRTETPLATMATATPTGSYIVNLPMPEEVIERYLEVRDVITGEAITVIEVLSPSNKAPGERREQYERKRMKILQSDTNLIEIDLLRSGKPMAMQGHWPNSHYRLLVSRSEYRPKAEVFPFNVQDPIPPIPVPLRPGEPEPLLDLNEILHTLYDQAGYDISIDYRKSPIPPFEGQDVIWVQELLNLLTK